MTKLSSDPRSPASETCLFWAIIAHTSSSPIFYQAQWIWPHRFYFSFTSSFYYLTLILPFRELFRLHLGLLGDSPMSYCLLAEQPPLFPSTHAISQPPGSHPSHDSTVPNTTSTPSLSNTCILINPGLSLIWFISIHTDHCPNPYIIIHPGHSLNSFIPFLSGHSQEPCIIIHPGHSPSPCIW